MSVYSPAVKLARSPDGERDVAIATGIVRGGPAFYDIDTSDKVRLCDSNDS